MRVYDHHAVNAKLAWPDLIRALRESFSQGGVIAPARQSLSIDLANGEQATLLIMPAWEAGEAIGVKVVTFIPGMPRRVRRRSMRAICSSAVPTDGSSPQWMATH